MSEDLNEDISQISSDDALDALRRKLLGEATESDLVRQFTRDLIREYHENGFSGPRVKRILVRFEAEVVKREREAERIRSGRQQDVEHAKVLVRYMFEQGYTPEACMNKIAKNFTSLSTDDLNEVRRSLPMNETHHRHGQESVCATCHERILWDADLDRWWIYYGTGNPPAETYHCHGTSVLHNPKKEN